MTKQTPPKGHPSACLLARTRFAQLDRAMPQHHKGERVYVPSRLAPELAELLAEEAAQRRNPKSDIIAAAVAAYYGRQDLAPPLKPRTLPEELPMTG
jgi:hypothetical protein